MATIAAQNFQHPIMNTEHPSEGAPNFVIGYSVLDIGSLGMQSSPLGEKGVGSEMMNYEL